MPKARSVVSHFQWYLRNPLPGHPTEVRWRWTWGQPSFRAGDIPFTGMAPDLEVLEAPLLLPEASVTITALSIGIPIASYFLNLSLPSKHGRLGPQIERHPDFPNRVNVQFVEVIDRKSIRIESGAGVQATRWPRVQQLCPRGGLPPMGPHG